MEKHYWFYIDSYVYISINHYDVLLYNPYTGKFLEYRNDIPISSLVKKIRSFNNLQVIRLTETDLSDPQIKRFVDAVRDYFLGDLIDVEFSGGKPVLMLSYLKIQKDVKYLKNRKNRSIGEKLLNYLNEITLYITNECSAGCTGCKEAYRQFLCCGRSKAKKQELELDKTIRFLDWLKGLPSLHLNITGGNIFRYSEWEALIQYLSSWSGSKSFIVHYLNLENMQTTLTHLASLPSSNLVIPVSFPVEDVKLEKAMKVVLSSGMPFSFLFIIQKEEDIKGAELVLEKYPDLSPGIHPFYNGMNLEFFKDNLFIDRDRIEIARPTLKDIYINSVVNSVYFGKLVVFPDGKICAHANSRQLGFLGRESIYNLLMKEMSSCRSWRKVRRNVKPCRNCIFNCLCPPLSNINRVMRKNNLCDIQ